MYSYRDFTSDSLTALHPNNREYNSYKSIPTFESKNKNSRVKQINYFSF